MTTTVSRKRFPITPSYYPGYGKVDKAKQAKRANAIHEALDSGMRVYGRTQVVGKWFPIERITRIFHYSLEADTVCGQSVVINHYEILPSRELTPE